MENQVTTSLETLKFLTSAIREPTTKPVLRKPLQSSLERIHGYDLNIIDKALDLFFGGGLKAVQ